MRRRIVEAFQELKGENVIIHIEHKLFGVQNIQVEFKPEVEIGFGFHFKDQIIYIREDELLDCYISDKGITILGELMLIDITK